MKDADVVVVGYGPVGQVLALLLAEQDRQVTVVERWLEPYTMPRAVSYDDEAARILAATGITDRIDEVTELTRDYTFRSATGQTLIHIDVPEDGWSGWPDSISVYQPGLEELLADRGTAFPNLRVLRGHEAVGVAEDGDGVRLEVDGPEGRRTLTASYVVGCDGANSFVREHIGTDMVDFGFSNDWLICDVVLHEEREFRPNNLQICDPARPRTEVSAGPGHRRWEFMRVPGERVEDLKRTEKVWKLLGLFDVRPDNATLKRHAVYTVQARNVRRWRKGRLLIAGDAAHVMPPFVGQGMVSGFRDAINLAWKLGLVLDGRAAESLLDTYPTERRSHVRSAIDMSIEVGKMICQTNRMHAASRDAYFRNLPPSDPQPREHPPLTDGLLRRGPGGIPRRTAGALAPQGRVARAGRTGLFDEVVGRGFVLLTTHDPRAHLKPDHLAFLEHLGAHLVRIGAPGDDHDADDVVVDLDGVYRSYLADAGPGGVLVRPDFYVFGAASDADDLAPLVDDLRGQHFPSTV